ncbi:MAG: hypothetical protein R3Y27_04800, partial [Clostridia bacterium]
ETTPEVEELQESFYVAPEIIETTPEVEELQESFYVAPEIIETIPKIEEPQAEIYNQQNDIDESQYSNQISEEVEYARTDNFAQEQFQTDEQPTLSNEQQQQPYTEQKSDADVFDEHSCEQPNVNSNDFSELPNEQRNLDQDPDVQQYGQSSSNEKSVQNLSSQEQTSNQFIDSMFGAPVDIIDISQITPPSEDTKRSKKGFFSKKKRK